MKNIKYIQLVLSLCLLGLGLTLQGQAIPPPVVIGDLLPGEEIRIEYRVGVSALPFDKVIITNQGEVKGTLNGMMFAQFTDDPNVGGPNDPTTTLADPTPIFSYADTDGDGSIDTDDPCSCDDPENTVGADGLFLFHNVFSLTTNISNETWTLSANDGNFLDSNGMPITLGMAMTETPANSGNYILEFYHRSDVISDFSVSPDGGNINYAQQSLSCTATRDCLIAVGIPTMGQWALFILGLMLLNIGLVFVLKMERSELS